MQVEHGLYLLYLTIIPRVRVGYEWNTCFVKNNQVILIGLADFHFKSNHKTIYGCYFLDMV